MPSFWIDDPAVLAYLTRDEEMAAACRRIAEDEQIPGDMHDDPKDRG